jgi:hypothetical protein
VISPPLFSIYINDVPVMFNRNKSYTLLFADDISTFFIFKKSGSVKKTIKDYMLKMELWLSKWRLTMHPKKCNQMVFNSSGSKILNNSFHFELFKERIPPCESLKFLGITFDLSLSFNQHIKEIKKNV